MTKVLMILGGISTSLFVASCSSGIDDSHGVETYHPARYQELQEQRPSASAEDLANA